MLATDRFEEDPKLAVSSAEIHLRSPVLESAEEAELLPMVTGFLSYFRFSPDLISLAETLTARRLSPLSREFLLNLRFDGSVCEAPRRSAANRNELLNELLVVTERDIVADLLLTPLRMLTSFVTSYAEHWKRVKAEGLRVFFQHSADGVFPIEVETRVARAYGFDSAGGYMIGQQVSFLNSTLFLLRQRRPTIC